MSVSSLIEMVEAEGFGRGGVVAAAFGDVQVAGVLEGRDDGGADGGQVGRSAAGPAGGGVFAEGHVADVVVRFDGPLLADQPGQVAGGGVRAGQAGDSVDGLAGGLAGGGVLAPAGDLDGLAGMREVQAADVGGLDGAGLGAAVPFVAGAAAGRYLPPGQGPDPGVQQRLVLFYDSDVVGLLVRDQPVQVRPHGMQGIEGDHGAGQVRRPQELGEVAGLIVPVADLDVVQQVPAVLGGTEQVHPGAVGAAGPAGGLAVHGDSP